MTRRKGNHSKTKIHKVLASFLSSSPSSRLSSSCEYSSYSTCLLRLTRSRIFLNLHYSHPKTFLLASLFPRSVSPDHLRIILESRATNHPLPLFRTFAISIFSFIYGSNSNRYFSTATFFRDRTITNFPIVVDNQEFSNRIFTSFYLCYFSGL